MSDDFIKPYTPKKKRFGFSAVFMLLFVLVTVFLLTMEINRRLPEPDRDIKDLAGAGRVGIADSVYFNRPFYFTQKLVAPSWNMYMLTGDTLLRAVNTDAPVFEQVKWYLQMSDVASSDTLAKTTIGVLKWNELPDIKNLSIQIMAEILEKYETKSQRADILVPATMPAHHVLVGYYWSVVLPESENMKNNVWVLSVMPRRNITYIVLNQTSGPLYQNYQKIFQKVNHGFKALSMMDRDADYRF